MPDLTLQAIVGRVLSADRTRAHFTPEAFSFYSNEPLKGNFPSSNILLTLLTTFPPISTVTCFDFCYIPSWKPEYLLLIPRLFPQLKEITITSKHGKSHPIPVFVQDVVNLMWELPLEVIELHQVLVDKNRTMALPRGRPLSAHTLRVWKARTCDKVFNDTTWELFPNVEVYQDNHLPFSILSKWSKLKELVSMVIIAETNLNFVHPGLEKFSFLVAMRRKLKTWSIAGSAPRLKQFKFESSRFLKIEGIPEMLTACENLEVIDINCVDSWKIAWEVTRNWNAGQNTKIIITDNFSSLSQEDRWNYIVEMIQEGRNLHPHSVFVCIKEVRQFEEIKSWLYEVCSELKTDHIGGYFWTLAAESFSPFVHLTAIEFSKVGELTTVAFDTLVSNLPQLERLLLTASPSHSNSDFTIIQFQSNSLQTLSLDGFVYLEGYDILSHSLRTLELNNCGHNHDCFLDEIENYPNFGNFGELLLRDLLDNSPLVTTPFLRELTISHESFESEARHAERLLVDVTCQVGHPNLEKLTLHNCAHVHTLKLTELPKLIELNITYEENLFKGLAGSVNLIIDQDVDGVVDLP
ncbi:hypothetical protein K7432_008386 [Basidiobolus ranarum]|uniref:Uncharacterized protein n=1 Tax=Basidiobolus ranarum TaxID=34480 RepID=A0ABR2VYN4_9FUNG